MRKDLEEFYNRKEFLKDENRSESVKKRHKKGSRTARENIEDLCDKDSFDFDDDGKIISSWSYWNASLLE